MYFIKSLIIALTNTYTLVVFVYVLMSWLPNVTSGVVGQVYNVLGKICDPFLNIFKRLIPPIGGMIDITPIIAIVVLQIVVQFIVRIL